MLTSLTLILRKAISYVQVPVILDYLTRHELQLQGTEVVDIGSWKGEGSHALSIRLSPLHIKAASNPRMTLEQYWQDKKCLAVWERDPPSGTQPN